MAGRNWVEISRAALRRNCAYVRGLLPPGTELCAVVKADAYGHGAVECGRVFAACGAAWLAVTSVEEGVRLRQAGIAARILVLAGFAAEEAEALVAHRLTPAVWDAGQVAWLEAARPPEGFPIHLKLDTGMGRLGVTEEQAPHVMATLAAVPRLRVEAVFSHLAMAEAEDGIFSRQQHRRLTAVAEGRPWHLLNGEATLRYAEWGGLVARVGLPLYGYSAQMEHAARLEPALAWKARVVSVKELPAGHGVGYGARFRAPARMRAATLAVGYADGYRRDLWPEAVALLRGQPAPVAGAISMDLTTVDAGNAPQTTVGDEAVLIGDGLTATRLAGWADTVPYEILCGISARVPRVYLD
jgi:alanine racemase